MMVTLVSPIPGAPFSSDGFGARAPIVTPGGTSGSFHYGQDFDVPAWTPIRAAAAGRVIVSGRVGTYGFAVYIDHGGGTVTRYAHMIAQPSVTVGSRVEQGDVIGFVGSTGASTGNHLHFEIRIDGVAVDPRKYLTTTPPAGQKAEDTMSTTLAMRYTRAADKVVVVCVGDTGSGFEMEYRDTSGNKNLALDNKLATAFKTGDYVDVPEYIAQAFKRSLAQLRLAAVA